MRAGRAPRVREEVFPGARTLHRPWKNHRFEALDALADEGLLSAGRRAKSVYFTNEGLAKARALQRKYLSQE